MGEQAEHESQLGLEGGVDVFRVTSPGLWMALPILLQKEVYEICSQSLTKKRNCLIALRLIRSLCVLSSK